MIYIYRHFPLFNKPQILRDIGHATNSHSTHKHKQDVGAIHFPPTGLGASSSTLSESFF